MPTSIRMPQLGESVAEGTVVRWLRTPGERVERDEPLLEIVTDKVTAEIPSPVAGILSEVLVGEGQTVAVGQELARLVGSEEAEAATQAGADAGKEREREGGGETERHGDVAAGAAATGPSRGREGAATGVWLAQPGSVEASSPSSRPAHPEPAGRDEQIEGHGSVAGSPHPSAGERRFYTPVVLRMAAEHGIDLARVQGTGSGGRVTRKDLERLIEARQPLAGTASAAPAPAAAPAAPAAGPAPDEEWLALTPMRRAIAGHLSRSASTVPQAWTMVEADVTSLVRWRSQVQADWQRREGFELTALPFVVKAAVEALKEHPEVNSQWADDHIVLKRRVHVGIAVSVPDGLVVPVVHDADRHSIAGLARIIRGLVQRARAGQLALPDVQGATFTVNNPGAFGSVLSWPIIPASQAAIMTMEAIQRRPVVVRDDAIAIRDILPLCISFDHRVLDGAQVLAFLQSVRRRLEAFGPDTPLY